MTARELEKKVGHPEDLREALVVKVQDEIIKRFSEVQEDWLRLMWSLDAFRIAGVTPTDMGKGGEGGFEGVYRSKGNWFALLLGLIIDNQTGQHVGSRTKVQGFSQTHQIDLAWPPRKVDPLVCAETKVTGAPASGKKPARGAMSDWSNRRKELKFAATDLKLARRQQETTIQHWDVWRQDAPPKCFFLWAARLDPGKRDTVDRMAEGTRSVVNTYLDGAGVFAWKENASKTAYEAARVPPASRASELDDVLYRIASEIQKAAGKGGKTPPPVGSTAAQLSARE